MMNRLIPCLCLALATAWMLGSIPSRGDDGPDASKAKPKEVLRHVVLFQFKSSTAAEKVGEIEAAFARLPDQIDAILDFEWGTNNSPEGLDAGFTHCFQVTFRNEKGRAAYLPHPAHKKFVELVGPHVEKVLVVDYEPK